MPLKRALITALALLVPLAAPLAHAGKEGEVEINGNLDSVTIVLGSNTVRAKGLGNDAKSNIGVINDATINGTYRQTVIVGNASTQARSAFTDAETQIGTLINSDTSGNVNRTIMVGNVVTHARSLGASATTKIGSVENARLNSGFKQTIILGEVVTDARHIGRSATTCIGTIRGGSHGGHYRTVEGDVKTKSKSGKAFGISTGSIGAKSKSTYIDDRGC